MERSPRSADGSAGRRTRRTLATSTTAVALGASVFAGAGTAQAESPSEPLVVDSALAVVDATVGQPIAVDPATMDFKVRQAVLLAMPLAFGEADSASERFTGLDPISLGRAEEGSTFYSGSEIAEAAAPHLAEIGLPEDKVDDVRWHFDNLVSGGNGVTVRGEKPEEPAEPTPAPDDGEEPAQQPPSSEPAEPSEPSEPARPSEPSEPATQEPRPQPRSEPQPSESASPATTEPRPDRQLPVWTRGDQDVTSIRPDMSTPPSAGQLPDLGLLLGRGGDVPPAPEGSPEDGPPADRGSAGGQDPASGQERERADTRAAGQAEAVPTSSSSPSITAPVVLAAAALAVVSAGLVRTWVLRRQ